MDGREQEYMLVENVFNQNKIFIAFQQKELLDKEKVVLKLKRKINILKRKLAVRKRMCTNRGINLSKRHLSNNSDEQIGNNDDRLQSTEENRIENDGGQKSEDETGINGNDSSSKSVEESETNENDASSRKVMEENDSVVKSQLEDDLAITNEIAQNDVLNVCADLQFDDNDVKKKSPTPDIMNEMIDNGDFNRTSVRDVDDDSVQTSVETNEVNEKDVATNLKYVISENKLDSIANTVTEKTTVKSHLDKIENHFSETGGFRDYEICDKEQSIIEDYDNIYGAKPFYTYYGSANLFHKHIDDQQHINQGSWREISPNRPRRIRLKDFCVETALEQLMKLSRCRPEKPKSTNCKVKVHLAFKGEEKRQKKLEMQRLRGLSASTTLNDKQKREIVPPRVNLNRSTQGSQLRTFVPSSDRVTTIEITDRFNVTMFSEPLVKTECRYQTYSTPWMDEFQF